MSRYVSAATKKKKTITKTFFYCTQKTIEFSNIFRLFIAIIRLDMQSLDWWWWWWWACRDLPCQLSWHFCKWIMNNLSAWQFVALYESAEIVTDTFIDMPNCLVILATPALSRSVINGELMNGFWESYILIQTELATIGLIWIIEF